MKDKKFVFFDNTDNTERFDEMQEFLFDAYAEDNGWKTKEDIPESEVYDAIYDHLDFEYNDFTAELDRYLSSGVFLLQGTCGRWNGPVHCGQFVRNFHDISSGLQHLDYIKFYELNGHFYIEGSHHDGRDKYELKQLTDKGIALAERHWFAHDRELHNKIMQNSNYSKLPRIAHAIYGA